MRRNLTVGMAVGVALVILVAGITYSIVRPSNWESQSTVVLTPTVTDPAALSGVLDSVQRSGVVGTYVELLASNDTKKRAGSPPVTVDVRAVPDTRVIRVTTSSENRRVVQPALSALLRAAQQEQQKLRDLWRLEILQSPSGAEKAGTPTSLILLATILLALLGAIAVVSVLRRTGLSLNGREARASRAEPVPDGGWVREGSRYPTER